MKKMICLGLVFIMTLSLCACGEAGGGEADDGDKKSAVAAEEKCDLDISGLNYNMAYAQINNIMSNPQDYEGKIIKMKGTFQVYEGELQNYYVCSISDTTACCSAGMEFILKGGRKYPDDYPALNDEITVTGEFETYLEGDKKYCHLINAKLG